MHATVKSAILVTVILLIALLTGCKVTYSHDFSIEQTFIDETGIWGTSGSDYSFSDRGLLIDDMAMAAPISFKGDFECTFEFETELPDTDTDYVDFTFFMIDGNVDAIGSHAGIVTEYYDLLTARHSIGQGDSPYVWDDRSWAPDGMADDVNEFVITRAGNSIGVNVNGLGAWTFNLDSGNLAQYYRPYLFVRHNGFTPDAGFYLKSVKVKYEKGNSL